MLTPSELKLLGSSDGIGSDPRANQQDAKVLEAATLVMRRKHRGASILVPDGRIRLDSSGSNSNIV